MPTKLALCGHPYQVTETRGRRFRFCEDCRPAPEPRPIACVTCRKDLTGRSPLIRYCSDRCRDISHGVRRAAPLPERVCALAECEVVFHPYRDGQRCCTERHGKLLYNRESRADGRQTRPAWDDKRRAHWQRRRAVKAGASTGRPVIRDEIAARDEYVCGICREPVEMSVAWPDPMSPSLDHVIPLRPIDGSTPGLHDPDNVQLAHLGCNSRKNNRPL